ncbi:YafY family protein [uncultured Tateyamaria sp.]|uniref:helix-turn-helix transcriptional regulator n=1 Tax=uncultured Tateyamaria sp. TaxID=455651 RepID=UPI00261440CB|nr:YafY family protein [uncultured Tateyamaria sp.]
MAKTSRFFEIIQILRAADTPVMAKEIARELEVSKRTIYRDIATLQAMRTPIHGEAGVGYIIRGGYDLPPINFDQEEAEAITVGLSMVARTGDADLLKAAKRAARKLHDAAPAVDHLLTSSWGVQPSDAVNMKALRLAIREEQKLDIRYRTKTGVDSTRIVLPLALIFYFDNVLLVAWCELRRAFRHFRIDRMTSCRATGDTFVGEGKALREEWDATQRSSTVET